MNSMRPINKELPGKFERILFMKEEFKKSGLSENPFTENLINHCVADTYRGSILTYQIIKDLVRIRQSLTAWDNRESLHISKCIESANLHTIVDIERQPGTSELLAISDFLHHLRQDVADSHALYQYKKKTYHVLEEVIQREHLSCQTHLVILMLLQKKYPWEVEYISHLILQAVNQLNIEYNLSGQRKSKSPIREHLFCSI